MNEFQAIGTYFRADDAADWRWDDDGRAVSWHDGSTIAVREEIRALVELIEPGGMPPFGSVVMILAALQGKFPRACTSALGTPPADERGQMLQRAAERQQRYERESLEILAQVATKLRRSIAEKAALIDTVLERAPKKAAESPGTFHRAFDHPIARSPGFKNEAPSIADSLRHVLDGLRPYTVDTLLARIRTGLDVAPAPVEAIDLELPREERAKRLFASLETDDEFGGLAQIARDLMAALRLPQLLVEPDELALGGAADLTNRGSLDRLLLSELAYDDLTLATRVALNEALYLRREPPVHKPERGLAVLLDAGIRMWGVPRVLGVSAALALLSRHELRGVAEAWRANGRKLESVDLLDRAGLDAHLAAMTTELSPGAAIPAWSAAIDALGDVDAVLITHRDALADRTFQARLAEANIARGFVVTVERDGVVELHALPWGSPRPLAAAKVDVEKLLPRPKKKTQQLAPPPPLQEPELADFPVFFRRRPSPLALPVNTKVSRAERCAVGTLCVTKDGRLFQCQGGVRGARQLATNLPGGPVAWLGLDSTKESVVVVRGRLKKGRCSLAAVSLDGSGPMRICEFDGPDCIPAVHLQDDLALVILRREIVVISLSTFEVMTRANIPAGRRWLNGRYFVSEQGFEFISWDGSGVAWDSAMSGRVGARDIVTAFDHEGVGAYVLTRAGHVLSPTGNELCRAPYGVTRQMVFYLEDGIALSGPGQKPLRLDVKARRFESINEWDLAVETGTPRPPHLCLHRYFRSVRFSKLNGLQLTSAGGWTWVIEYSDPGGFRLNATKFAEGPEEPLYRVDNGQSRRRLGCELSHATSPTGTRIWFDSRGLLHIRSQVPSLPELTIALCEHESLAIWCSDGVVCGPQFFRTDDGQGQPALIAERLKAIWAALC